MSKTVKIKLPEIIPFNGSWDEYIQSIYDIFKHDFIDNITKYNNQDIKLKWHPIYQDRPSAFYHITHEGKDEKNRNPDLRRCERIPWAKPVITNCQVWKLKIWPQNRKGKSRICIWLNLDESVNIESNLENHYFIILEKRIGFYLLWNTFIPKYNHEIRSKNKEYTKWLAKKQKSPERRS